MKLPNWFKILWWIILLLITSFVVCLRFNAIKNGSAVPFDVSLFIIWVALMVVPIFSEIELFGLKLKREIEDLKSQINIKFGDLKNEIKLSQSQNFTANILGYGPPPPDNRIAGIQQQLDKLIMDKVKHQDNVVPLEVPKESIELFKVRFNIEKEISRIWEGRYDGELDQYWRRKVPIYRQIQDLQKYEIIDGILSGLLRDMLSICNYGIHGEDITKSQIDFVEGYSEKVVNYLKDIK
jgi:hypothetical protein